MSIRPLSYAHKQGMPFTYAANLMAVIFTFRFRIKRPSWKHAFIRPQRPTSLLTGLRQ